MRVRGQVKGEGAVDGYGEPTLSQREQELAQIGPGVVAEARSMRLVIWKPRVRAFLGQKSLVSMMLGARATLARPPTRPPCPTDFRAAGGTLPLSNCGHRGHTVAVCTAAAGGRARPLSSRLVICRQLAVLSPLAEVANDQPLVCLAADAQWFDRVPRGRLRLLPATYLDDSRRHASTMII